MTITIIGLGPGDPGMITRAAWQAMTAAKDIYLRTRQHPCVADLPQSAALHSFDDVYDSGASFEQVYETIVEHLLAAESGEDSDVLYAVPGDPLIGEATVKRLLLEADSRSIEVRILNGVSFVEPTLAALAAHQPAPVPLDALDGLQVVDALTVGEAYHPSINPDLPALVAQVYSAQIASEVKLTLTNQYPDEHPVWLVHGASTSHEQVETAPLYEIDRSSQLSHLTTLYLPPLSFALSEDAGNAEGVNSFEGFQNTVAHLRAPDGCPWDREQTHQSLRSHLLEETYEVLAALDAGDADALREELGDLLLQVVLHAQIGVDEGEFYMGQVIAQIDAKLKRRHPHVWGEVEASTPEQVKANWEQLKAKERGDKGRPDGSALAGVPEHLPSLAQAHAYDTRAARLGFDWDNVQGVLAKLHEEIGEVNDANTPEEQAYEIGDVLFVVASWARWLKVDPESALRAANQRFSNRFKYVERLAREQERPMTEMSLEELDTMWEAAKKAIDNEP